MKTAALPSAACPSCRYVVDHASSTTAPGAPKPGNVTVCGNCGTVGFFADDLTIREGTREEIQSVMASRIGHQIRTIQIYIADRGPIHPKP
jgi:hypothetical protein